MKVQHKQLREEQQQNRLASNNDSGYDNASGMQYVRGQAPLPPSGPMAMNSSWYNNRPAQPGGGMAAQIGVTTENESQNQHNNTNEANSNPGISNENPDGENLPSLDSLRQSLPDA